MIEKIGVQTFTIRKLINTPEKLYTTLLDLSRSGIKNFELARISFSKEELAVLLKLKRQENLNFSVCQIKLKDIEKNLDWYQEFCNMLDIKYLEVAVIPMKSFLKREKGLLKLSDRLNILGRRVKEKGINLLYHHHHFEMVKYNNKLSLNIIMDNTDPNLVNFVADTYWLARGGFNPAKYIDDNKSRIKGIHLRDYELNFKKFDFSITDSTVGKGTIDFKEIVDKDKNWNVDFYSIEEATDEPINALNESYNYLSKLCE